MDRRPTSVQGMSGRLSRAGWAHLGLSLAVTTLLVGLLARGLALEATQPLLAGVVLTLFAINTQMLVVAALTALCGLRREAETDRPVAGHPAPGRCAVLWLICGEPPEPLATRIERFLEGLAQTGQARDCDVFILSDTQGASARREEARAFAGLAHRVTYRNRAAPEGRKPGNLRDWLADRGADYATMLILDTDSGFSPVRLAAMRARMAADPALGLVQAAIRLRPAGTRFGVMQRLAARLSGPVFARGLARLSGDAGNYWGHNALLRVAAFRDVAHLPDLPGAPPFGGPVLSHDFIEAAFLRRAGWKVVIAPESRGSFEDAPETVATHLRRDRRWAQGNLQHLRLIGARGLHPASRLHLLAGIQSYLSAPIWLVLVLLTGSGAVHATAGVIWPLLGVLGLLLAPKVAGVMDRAAPLRSRRARRVLWRALWAELGLTTLFAPIGMIRRSGFVLAVLAGRDHGWQPSGQSRPAPPRQGLGEMLAGGAVILAVTLPQLAISGADAAFLSALLVLPVALPLLAAPLICRWFDAPRRFDPVAAYYDANTRRFLALGGTGRALAIHRPLWADGVRTREAAATHVNHLIAAEAEAALGRAPLRVCDLGCGVGGTLFHLARVWPEADLCGITISAEQVRMADTEAEARGLGARCRFIRSDFTLPMTLARADLVIAVESHVHAATAADFLLAATRHLRPGGVLVIVDDMLAAPEGDLPARDAARIAEFRRGWRLGHVPHPAGLAGLAGRMGLDALRVQDLTPLLRLNRLRDRALRFAGPLADRAGLAGRPFFDNMIGGNALTESYRAGALRYTLMVLQSPASAARPALMDRPEPLGVSA
ncbi:MAG: glucans biosynthesis glucosyltransferase MdoH [Pseudorhodobacter sp.]